MQAVKTVGYLLLWLVFLAFMNALFGDPRGGWLI